MLQDPYEPVRAMGLGAINSRLASGDKVSVMILQALQQQKTAYGMDSEDASKALLKMSGHTIEKEFEVKDKPKAAEKK